MYPKRMRRLGDAAGQPPRGVDRHSGPRAIERSGQQGSRRQCPPKISGEARQKRETGQKCSAPAQQPCQAGRFRREGQRRAFEERPDSKPGHGKAAGGKSEPEAPLRQSPVRGALPRRQPDQHHRQPGLRQRRCERDNGTKRRGVIPQPQHGQQHQSQQPCKRQRHQCNLQRTGPATHRIQASGDFADQLFGRLFICIARLWVARLWIANQCPLPRSSRIARRRSAIPLLARARAAPSLTPTIPAISPKLNPHS